MTMLEELFNNPILKSNRIIFIRNLEENKKHENKSYNDSEENA